MYGYGLRFNTSEIPETKRMSIGVKTFNLATNDVNVGVKEIGKHDKYIVIITEKGNVKKIEDKILKSSKRRAEASSLISLYGKDTVNSVITCDDKDDIMVITRKGTYTLSVDDIETSLKYEEGKKLIPIKHNDSIVKVFRPNP